MIVLPQDQIDRMSEIMDDILRNTSEVYTVKYFKKKYKLSSAEYDMIYDLTMPLIREINIKRYWRAKYSSLVRRIRELCYWESLTKANLIDRLLFSIAPSPGEEHMGGIIENDEESDETEDLEVME